jgi:hypothetical protein
MRHSVIASSAIHPYHSRAHKTLTHVTAEDEFVPYRGPGDRDLPFVSI